MIVSIIVAVSENDVIGKDNSLIWHLPVDMKFFKDKTIGHCIITGRKNYESIPGKFRPLPNRTNIVVTRQTTYKADGAIVTFSIQEALDIARNKGESEVFVIGGADIYMQTIDLATKLYLTRVHQRFEGDAFFPNIDTEKWKEVSRNYCLADEKNLYDYSFIEYHKI